ncbi:MAG: hypothetical protein WDZ48_08770 [Pirellulales bacterium]
MKCTKLLGSGLLVVAFLATGCSKPGDTKPAVNKSGAAEAGATTEHSHGTGPNGGVVFDLGKHHAEFTVDHGKQQCTILFLGDDEKTPTAVTASEFTLTISETKTKDGTKVEPMTITMLPESSTDGNASKFVGTNPGIGNVADFAGTVSGEIDGKPAQGEFKE